MSNNNKRIAILIDGDNAQPKMLELILEEVAKFGQITIRRIYGDWTGRGMTGWKNLLNTNAIQPIQQFAYTKGKNATDSTLIIDAMDILHGKLVDGFAIVSSDSDYTRLATRMREEGIFVMGIGEKKTPSPFVKACEQFIFTENLIIEEEVAAAPKKKDNRSKVKLVKLLRRAFNMVVEENDMAYLGKLGEALRRIDPGFDVREYGFRTMTSMFKSLNDTFEVVTPEGGTSIYIRLVSKRN